MRRFLSRVQISALPCSDFTVGKSPPLRSGTSNVMTIFPTGRVYARSPAGQRGAGLFRTIGIGRILLSSRQITNGTRSRLKRVTVAFTTGSAGRSLNSGWQPNWRRVVQRNYRADVLSDPKNSISSGRERKLQVRRSAGTNLVY